MSWITLSPKAYRAWKNLIARHFYGDGYTVDFISHSAVRYQEGARSITLSTEPLTVQEEGGKTHWVLEVYVRRPLKWDSPSEEEVTDPAQEKMILSRLEVALESNGERYRFVREAV